MTKQRRSNRGAVLRQSSVGWHIAAATVDPSQWSVVHGPGKIDANELAKNAAEFVATHALSASVLLMLDSKSSYAAKISDATQAEIRDPRVMDYRLEELLPIAAEDFSAGYITDGKDSLLGIATPTRVLAPIVGELEKHGLQVQSISPQAVLAMQSYLESNSNTSGAYVLWQDEECLELFRLGKKISDWRHLPLDATSLKQQIGAMLLRSKDPLKIHALGVEPSICDDLSVMQGIDLEIGESVSLPEHAYRSATSVLAGKVQPWVELRRGNLEPSDPHRAVRREWQWCQWALACLLLCSAFFFWMRGRQYESKLVSMQDQQVTLYKQVFPNSRAPSAVLSRLRSEQAKLLGARGNDAAVQQPPSALNVLFELVAGMPEDLRLQAQQLRVEDGKIYLDVNVRTVGDAGELADALEQRGFSIEPPTTEQFDAKKVSVRIMGKLLSERAEREEAGP